MPRTLAAVSVDAPWREALGAHAVSEPCARALRSMRDLFVEPNQDTFAVHTRARALSTSSDALDRTAGAVMALAIEQQLFLVEVRTHPG